MDKILLYHTSLSHKSSFRVSKFFISVSVPLIYYHTVSISRHKYSQLPMLTLVIVSSFDWHCYIASRLSNVQSNQTFNRLSPPKIFLYITIERKTGWFSNAKKRAYIVLWVYSEHCQASLMLLPFLKCFRKKSPSKMFEGILNTSLISDCEVTNADA